MLKSGVRKRRQRFGSAFSTIKIEIVNLGLEPWEAIDMGLEVETVEEGKEGKKKRRPVAEYAGAIAAIKKPSAAALAKGIKGLFKQEPDREWRDHIERGGG